MSDATSLPARYFHADHAEFLSAVIVSHAPIAEQTHRIRLDCPAIAAAATPGQFAMLRIPDRADPLLARPLAVYDTFSEPRRYVDFVYTVHGKFTSALKEIPAGREMTVWGPLGNGFDVPAVEHLVLVAGGIGQTALLALGRERLGDASYGPPTRRVPRARRVTLCWGARHAGLFGDVDDFRRAGIDVHLATLDGSAGRRGTVVDLLDDVTGGGGDAGRGGSMHVACCGPEGMMAAVSRWSAERGVRCDVSLEAPMACGIGICFTCVAPVRDASGGWDYRRTCIEGPVFDSALIDWQA
ncbi:MAG: dihydroorotate dehydrogenase electron transfer subunit [Planctomycetia bacterium]|nr:dihydroorotate dehydrogenase electron transfer subunit [Planctomycetia bacterium]